MEVFSRVNRPIADAEPYYTRLAPWYDHLAASEKKFILQGIQLLDPRPGEWILEIGFGTAFAQQRIAPALSGGFSIGLDLSAGMCQIARKRLDKTGLIGQAALLQNNTLPIPIQSESLDAIFSSFTLELFDTPLLPQVLAECRRVLKRGGRLVVVSLSKDQPLRMMGRLYEFFHNRFPTLADCRPIPVKSLIAEAGLTIQESYENKMWGIPVGIVLASKDSLNGR